MERKNDVWRGEIIGLRRIFLTRGETLETITRVREEGARKRADRRREDRE